MAGLLNWFAQVAAVTKFGLMGIPKRLGSVLAALVGTAGVVGVLVAVLSMAVGFRKTMSASASPDAAIVLRSGADSEMVSGFSRDNTRLIADAPGLARDAQGPLASAELYVIIDLLKRSSGTGANVPLRGVGPAAFKVRDGFKIVQGRPFDWGKNEVIAGVGALKQFKGTEVGSKLKVGQGEWQVVGTFAASGGTAESEIWTDATILQQAFNRGDSFQSVYARLAGSSNAFYQFSDALNTNPQLSVQVMRQSDYYANQSTVVTALITTLGYLITGLMAVGAVFGALNTMYSAVSARTREIATLRALGFGTGSVVASVMLESVAVAVVGGAVGAGLARMFFNGFETATMNWQSFSQVTFAFAVTGGLLLEGIILAAMIGLVGGLMPAVRAARLPIASALREL
jgi:putative ABC transport system permease protein